jgi:hypothetical protein
MLADHTFEHVPMYCRYYNVGFFKAPRGNQIIRNDEKNCKMTHSRKEGGGQGPTKRPKMMTADLEQATNDTRGTVRGTTPDTDDDEESIRRPALYKAPTETIKSLIY